MKEEFIDKIQEHEISVLECLFLPKCMVVKESEKFVFNLDLSKLRKSISQKSSNSFVKAKKSLFHSLIIIFGIQMAKNGKIINYSEANKYWNEIVLCENNNWDYYKNKYKPIYNNLITEFRKVVLK
jgi:hypothetical protein